MNFGIISGADGPTAVFLSTSARPETILFLAIIALLLIHEMDAIRAKEWKLFSFLRSVTEETAYRVFVSIHLPLYLAIFYLVFLGGTATGYATKLVIDIFLLAHAILHFFFRKKEHNGFNSPYSKAIIYSMAALALAHLILLIFFSNQLLAFLVL